MLRFLTLLLLESAQLKLRYVFNKIYDTKVIDLSHNGYHAVKDASGGSSMINTQVGSTSRDYDSTLHQAPAVPHSL
jgi:hypothetical protein